MATTSRLLEALLSEAETTRDRVAWARAVCRAASHQARSGRHDAALASLAKVRKVFGPGLHPEVASWLMLSEGILHWCQYQFNAGYDRMRRAHALAVAFGTEVAVPSCAAWMAAAEYNDGEFHKMAEHLGQSFTLARPKDHQARCRATLTLGSAYLIAGDVAEAQRWFEQARRHATAEGDEASLGAMLFNVAVLRLAKIRVDDAFGLLNERELDRVTMEVDGSATFDHLTSNPVQEAWRFLMLARHRVICGRYDEALGLFGKALEGRSDLNASDPAITIDRAWCLACIGDKVGAEEEMDSLASFIDHINDSDDKAYVLARLAKIAAICGKDEAAQRFGEVSLIALDQHKAFQGDLLKQISSIPSSATM